MRKPALLRHLILSPLICAFLAGGVVSQSLRIDSKRPSVYLTFKDFVKQAASEAHQTEGVRLVLHNNTRWPILFGEWLEPVRWSDVPMGYVIEMEDGSFAVRRHVDVVTRGKLLPGKTISFIVPREDFPKNSRIYVEFEFSWELSKGQRLPDRTVHRAYFFSSDLPRWP